MFMNPSITDRVSCPPVKPPTCDDLAAKARGTVADVVRCVGSAITSRPDRMRLKSVLICLAMLALPAAAAAPSPSRDVAPSSAFAAGTGSIRLWAGGPAAVSAVPSSGSTDVTGSGRSESPSLEFASSAVEPARTSTIRSAALLDRELLMRISRWMRQQSGYVRSGKWLPNPGCGIRGIAKARLRGSGQTAENCRFGADPIGRPKQKGRMLSGPFTSDEAASRAQAAFSRPSFFSASCTFGRAATRAL